MRKNYNLASKSDMRQFMKDLEKSAKEAAMDELHKQDHQVECPSCNEVTDIKLKSGLYHCKHCKEPIDFTLEIEYSK